MSSFGYLPRNSGTDGREVNMLLEHFFFAEGIMHFRSGFFLSDVFGYHFKKSEKDLNKLEQRRRNK